MGIPPAVIYWVDEAADIQIYGGICSCRFISGETIIEVRARVPTLLKSIGNGTRAFAVSLGQSEADVIGIIGRRTGGH